MAAAAKQPTVPVALDVKTVFKLVSGGGDAVSGEEGITQLLRGSGLTIYDAEVKKVVEKFGGKVSLGAYEAWFAENAKYYQRSSEDGFKALGSLISSGHIGRPGSKSVDIKQLKRVLGVLGDKIPPETIDRVMQGCPSKDGTVSIEELVAFLHSNSQQTLPISTLPA